MNNGNGNKYISIKIFLSALGAGLTVMVLILGTLFNQLNTLKERIDSLYIREGGYVELIKYRGKMYLDLYAKLHHIEDSLDELTDYYHELRLYQWKEKQTDEPDG